MIQREKLSQFYFNQYRDYAKKVKKKSNTGKKTYKERIDLLLEEMRRTKNGRVTQPHLEE